ncbi:HNH endonuclease [uncultured Actinomyces sp.]|uniref:HNH endonuclease n=1 Tax=uncultured Actinomyces sp. TaxID=249061 RepID=UPI0037DD8B99
MWGWGSHVWGGVCLTYPTPPCPRAWGGPPSPRTVRSRLRVGAQRRILVAWLPAYAGGHSLLLNIPGPRVASTSRGPACAWKAVSGVASSRTGTTQYKQWRTRVLAAARDAGVASCPICGVTLDYTQGRKPNSAEPDHILPARWGGRNTLDNGRVLCRRCNQSRGDGTRRRTPPRRASSVDVPW